MYVTLTRRSLRSGVVAAVLMAVFYIAVVRGASGSWTHLWDQVRLDWVYLTLILGGFGTQVTLIAELRYRHRLDAAATATGVSLAARRLHHAQVPASPENLSKTEEQRCLAD